MQPARTAGGQRANAQVGQAQSLGRQHSSVPPQRWSHGVRLTIPRRWLVRPTATRPLAAGRYAPARGRTQSRERCGATAPQKRARPLPDGRPSPSDPHSTKSGLASGLVPSAQNDGRTDLDTALTAKPVVPCDDHPASSCRGPCRYEPFHHATYPCAINSRHRSPALRPANTTMPYPARTLPRRCVRHTTGATGLTTRDACGLDPNQVKTAVTASMD